MTVRILCLIETLGRGGGAEQLLSALLPILQRGGLDVEIAALFEVGDDLTGELRAHGVTIHEFRLPHRRSVWKGVAKARSLVRQRKYDVFWGHLLLGNVYARVAHLLAGRGRLVATFHSKDVASPRGRFKLAPILERVLLGSADRKVAVSEALARDYKNSYGWTDLRVIHNGVDVALIRSLAEHSNNTLIRRVYGIADSDFLLVTPARLIPVKGHSYLLAAVKSLSDRGLPITLVLCGAGPLEMELRAQIRLSGLDRKVHIVGLLKPAALFPLMANADLVVVPSLYETFGLAPLEAIAAGTPVIATNVGGLAEAAGRIRGVTLVLPGSSTALSEAITSAVESGCRLVRDSDFGAGLDQYDINTCARAWRTLFDDLTTASE